MVSILIDLFSFLTSLHDDKYLKILTVFFMLLTLFYLQDERNKIKINSDNL